VEWLKVNAMSPSPSTTKKEKKEKKKHRIFFGIEIQRIIRK
jgi:hypothetical protein